MGEFLKEISSQMCLSELVPETLNELRRRNVPGHRYRWSTERIAEKVGFADPPNKAAGRVYRWAEDPEPVVRILNLVILAAQSGVPSILERLADEAGYCVYKLPKPGPLTMFGALKAAGEACRTAGDAANRFATAYDPEGPGGESVTTKELDEIDDAVAEVIRAALQLRAIAHQESGNAD